MSVIFTADDFLKVIVKDTKRKTTTVASLILRGVIDRSPVRTGAFKAAWSVTTSGARGRPIKKTGLTNKQIDNNKVFGDRDFPVINIFNPKKYGVFLENGTPKMAARHMVALTLASVRTK